MKRELYFAYGSNMNLRQMNIRCPDAKALKIVVLNDFALAFRGGNEGNGVATILPRKGSNVKGVLWSITADCKKALDRYEGYPHLYGRTSILVEDSNHNQHMAMVYTMNEPYKSIPCMPSHVYEETIFDGFYKNGINPYPLFWAIEETKREMQGDKESPPPIRKGDGKER